METESLTAQSRSQTGRAARRVAGRRIPAVLYGHNVKNKNLWLDSVEFTHVFDRVGESGIIELTVEDDKKPVPVTIRDIQRDPLTHKIIHADLYQVKMSEEMTADVPLVLSGESPAVKMGGTLIHAIDTLAVKCLPKDLPHEITVDISSLKTFDDHISVADLKVPEGVTVLTEPEVIVASVSAPRVEKEETDSSEETEEKPAEKDSESAEKKEE